MVKWRCMNGLKTGKKSTKQKAAAHSHNNIGNNARKTYRFE